MTIGEKIRYHRKTKGWTQEHLAKRVTVAPSYISKIENGRETGSPEIIQDICLLLDFHIDGDQARKQTIERMIEDWYKHLKFRELPQAKKQREKAIQQLDRNEFTELQLYFQVIDLRHQLALHDLNAAQQLIMKIQKNKDFFAPRTEYYFYQFKGLFDYTNYDCEDALFYYDKAENIARENSIELEPEFYYYKSVNYSLLNRVWQTLKYADKALRIFNHEGKVERSVDCRIAIGTNLKRIGEYQNAEEEFLYALQTAEKLNLQYDKAVIHHNLGRLYSTMGKHRLALDHLYESYKMKTEGKLHNLPNTIYQIAEELQLLNQEEKARDWIKEGFKLMDDPIYSFERYKIELEILRFEVDGNTEYEYIDYLENTALPFFQRKKDWNKECKCREKLSDFYYQKRRYRLASDHLYKINQLAKQNQPK